MPDTPNPLDVTCPSCHAGPGTPCNVRSAPGDHHADRTTAAQATQLTHGTCRLCGQPLVYGTLGDHTDTAWHPDPADAAACPPMPDPTTSWDAYARALQSGVRPGEPGTDNFIPHDAAEQGHPALLGTLTLTAGGPPDPVCPECRAGKHTNCDGTAWDQAADAPTTCACHTADHPGGDPE